ncbi:MAG: hypothetical protein HQK51_06750 [Oligoflexia bacterium]|nr:hypothetical protein [Oligoflexia bacterium]
MKLFKKIFNLLIIRLVKKIMYRYNYRGISLVEATMAAGILGGLALITSQVVVNFTKDSNKVTIDTSFFELTQKISAITSSQFFCESNFKGKNLNTTHLFTQLPATLISGGKYLDTTATPMPGGISIIEMKLSPTPFIQLSPIDTSTTPNTIKRLISLRVKMKKSTIKKRDASKADADNKPIFDFYFPANVTTDTNKTIYSCVDIFESKNCVNNGGTLSASSPKKCLFTVMDDSNTICDQKTIEECLQLISSTSPPVGATPVIDKCPMYCEVRKLTNAYNEFYNGL